MKASLKLTALALTGVLGLATEAGAQSYPDRQITVVVPFPAGGPSDVIARIVAEHMGKTLGKGLVIENVAGAGGTTGSARVAAAAPDGYTLLAGSMGSHVAAPVLTKNLKYDSRKDFEPIGLTLDAPAVVVVNKSANVRTLKEFVAYLKTKGDKATQGHGGVGASSHMACLLFTAEAKVKPSLVAYRGSALALNDVLSGQIDFVCDQTMGMTGQILGGNLKALVVASNERSPVLPNVPSAKEAGLPGYQLSIWSGFFAPKGTPKPIVTQLNAAISKALDDPATAKRLKDLGGSIPAKAARSPEALKALMDKEMTRWQPILTAAAAAATPPASTPPPAGVGAAGAAPGGAPAAAAPAQAPAPGKAK